MSLVTQRRVARALRPGGPEVVEVDLEDLSLLKDGEVLVRVEAAGLNHAETLIRSDSYAVRLPFPYAVGGEGSGTVVESGPDVTMSPGTRVCWAAIMGSCATFIIAPASMLVPIPDSLSFEDGACLPVAGLTAGGLARVWPSKGRTAVIWGAAGAVGCSWPYSRAAASTLSALQAEAGLTRYAQLEPHTLLNGRART